VAKLVLVSGGYGIDATEVTRSQYEAWLATAPSAAGQPAFCSSWNSTFAPNQTCMNGSSVCQGAGCAKHPQVCVDWCDAQAYCAASGKRLCGKIGGGSNSIWDHMDATKSQWHNACVSDGTNNAYPYGSTYSPAECNGFEAGKGTTVPAGSLTGCQSSVAGFQGVYDLSGNVWEWEDSCAATSGPQDACRPRGGSFLIQTNNLRCDNGVL
jgi:formylglycine-generating enzyme required for sulfatase activity